MNTLAFLQNNAFFGGVTPRHLASLAKICIPKKLKNKESLFYEGDKGLAIYLCINGNIQLYKSTNDGKDVVIRIIKPGELFAEVLLFERDTYPVSARAATEATVFTVPRKDFLLLLRAEAFRNDFIAMLMKKMRYLTDQIMHLTSYDVEDRFFLFLHEHYGPVYRIDLSISKKGLAAVIGATPETLSRLFIRLTKEKKITMSKKMLIIQKGFWEDWKI